MPDNLYAEYPALVWAAAIYGFLYISKMVLALASLPAAADAFVELHPEWNLTAAYVFMVVGMVVVGFFIIPSTLRKEGLGFFLAYSDVEVRDQMVAAFHAAHGK